MKHNHPPHNLTRETEAEDALAHPPPPPQSSPPFWGTHPPTPALPAPPSPSAGAAGSGAGAAGYAGAPPRSHPPRCFLHPHSGCIDAGGGGEVLLVTPPPHSASPKCTLGWLPAVTPSHISPARPPLTFLIKSFIWSENIVFDPGMGGGDDTQRPPQNIREGQHSTGGGWQIMPYPTGGWGEDPTSPRHGVGGVQGVVFDPSPRSQRGGGAMVHDLRGRGQHPVRQWGGPPPIRG